MKLGMTALLATVLAALLLVPAAGAKPGNGNGNGGGNGNGNGQGKPAWAGTGKPDQAAKDARKAARQAAKAERRAARAQAPDAADDEETEALNPAQVCRQEREDKGEEAFAEEYGTNGNKANAFGKCVSREAHDRDGVSTGDDETPVPDDDEEETTEPEAPEEGGATTAAQAFFAYLWPFLRV